MSKQKPSPPKTPAKPAPVVRALNPTFRLTFLCVVVLTALSLLASLAVPLLPQTDSTKQILEACLSTWKMGFGAVLGLLGGKTLR